jgi:hypothetical protein
MGCALFGIGLLTLFGASLAGWIALRRLRATATPYRAAIASLLLRLPSDALAVFTGCSRSLRIRAQADGWPASTRLQRTDELHPAQ